MVTAILYGKCLADGFGWLLMIFYTPYNMTFLIDSNLHNNKLLHNFLRRSTIRERQRRDTNQQQ